MNSFENYPLLAGLRDLDSEPALAVQNQLLEQLILALEGYYVHLPIKRSAFAADPVGQLKLLRASGAVAERTDFQRRVMHIISGLRDRHTTLTRPAPWNSLIAFVPLVIERCVIREREAYVVTKQLFGFDRVPVGSIITHWNGTPIDLKVRQLAAQSQGGNLTASQELGLAYLTVCPLAYVSLPAEDWVTLTYLDEQLTIRSAATPWRFMELGQLGAPAPSGPSSSSSGLGSTILGLDSVTLTINHFKRHSISSPPAPKRGGLQTGPFGVRYGSVRTRSGKVGYLRIFSFDVPDPVQFVTACAKILADLPQDRLIIDVRGNPGGMIPAGQKLIRLLTPQRSLVTSAVAFRNTEATRALATLPEFARWRESMELQYRTGEQFSQAFPMTDYTQVPSYRYPGAVGLIIDGLGYSTTDYFAADFQDNRIGVVVGSDSQTGGGGANVWTWSMLQGQAQLAGLNLGALPGGFGLNLSVRRSIRSGALAGIPVEDLGVSADFRCPPTLTDVLSGNQSIIEFTTACLKGRVGP